MSFHDYLSHQLVSYNIMQGMNTHNYLYALPLTAV